MLYLRSPYHIAQRLLGLIISLLLGLTLVGSPSSALASAPRLESDLPNAAGVIAYMNGRQEIRVINPDGSNDHAILNISGDEIVNHINSVAWSPDGAQLAFSSSHEQTCSPYRADIYTVDAGGGNLRRLTHGPKCADLSAYATGSVTVQVANQLFDQSIYFIYVEGMAEAQELVISPGAVVNVTLNNVADLGDGIMQRVVIFQTEQNNWIWPAQVDVVAGSTVDAGEFKISNSNKYLSYGAFFPSWRSDGAGVAFALGEADLYAVSASAGALDGGASLFPNDSVFGNFVAYSPVANEILFFHGGTVYKATPGDANSITALVELDWTLYGLDWLPDGSGFVLSDGSGFADDENGGLRPETMNIWKYTFAGSSLQQITSYTTEFAFHPSVSPDGQYVVFSYGATYTSPVDLRIMRIDGTEVQSLGVGGIRPDWGPANTVAPTATPTTVPTSTPPPATNTPAPTDTPTGQPTVQPTNTPTPLPAENLVQNGGFETGDLSSWIVSENSTVTVTGDGAYGGQYAAYFGGIDNANEEFYQQVNVPNTGEQGSLTFWVNQFSEESAEGADFFCASIYDANTVEQIFDLGCLDGVEAINDSYDAEAWWLAQYEFQGADWNALKGKAILLAFQMYTDGSLLTTVLIDNISFQTDSTAVATPTPTPISTAQPSAQRTWTAILYIDGDNDLCNAYPRLLTRMEQELGDKIGPNGFLNITVLIDHHPGYCQGIGNAMRYLIQPNGAYTDGVNRWDMGEIHMGDPQTLVDFAQWSMTNYPADHYYLAIDDHGGGITGLAWDETNGDDPLTTSELHAALQTITNNGQQKIDVLAYEACLMGMVENAYDVSPFTDYVFAFPTISWTNNASYPSYFGDGRFNAATDGRSFGEIIFDVYYESVTLPYAVSLVESAKMDAVQSALNSWASAVHAQLGSAQDKISDVRNNVQKVDVNGNDQVNNDDPYVDLWDAADKMAAQGIAATEGNALKAAIDAALVRSAFRPAHPQVNVDYSNVHGLTIFWPQSSQAPYPYADYVNGSLYGATAAGTWDDFLQALLGNSARRSMSATIGPVDRRVAPDIELPDRGSTGAIFLPLIRK